MKKKNKFLIIFMLVVLFILIAISSYKGWFFFYSGFNEFDYLLFNIIGDAVMVGIVTHVSTKYVSTYIARKEFDRNNKIYVTINQSRNGIINYEMFMSLYENQDVFLALEDEDRKIVDYVYKNYDCIIKTLKCEGTEKQLFDTILNIPFFVKYFADENPKESYKDIISKFDSKRFNNISIFKELLTDDYIDKLQKFSNIVLGMKHYLTTNLNNVEGCQLLITSDNRVECKIPCLPNRHYDLYMYYNDEHWIDVIAFSFDFDAKEYAKNLSGFKYSNSKEKLKPIKINLEDYIDLK